MPNARRWRIRAAGCGVSLALIGRALGDTVSSESSVGISSEHSSNPFLVPSGARSAESVAIIANLPATYTSDRITFDFVPRLRFAQTHGAAEAGRRIADLFERESVSYALGGALALAIAGVPRGTIDVDVNVFVEESEVPRVIALLAGLGMEVDGTTAAAAARRDGMFVARWEGMRIDVFLPSVPFSREAERTRTRVIEESGWSGWFLSAEALTVFKLLCLRSKDLADLERLIAVRPELDRAYVRNAIAQMMGEDDERVRRWDDLVRRFA